MSKTVYLSGPITGETYHDARYGWRAAFAALLPADIKVLSPMRHEGHLAEIKGPLQHAYPTHLFSHGKMIVAKDLLDIDVCDIMLVCVKGAKTISRGTLVEIGYARAKGKTIVTIMEKGNVHDYPFVTELSCAVVEDLETAAAIVASLLSEGI